MTSQINPLLNWLKTFQTEWLPENIPNNTNLLELIQTKLHEFEQIIIENNDDEEYHRARLLNDHSSSDSDNEQNALASTSTNETLIEPNSILPIDDNNEEIHARKILLEQSDDSEQEEEEDIVILRPTIRLKRISEIDAERYKPLAYRTEKEYELIDDIVSSSSSSTSTSDDEEYHLKYRTKKITPKSTNISPKKSSTPVKRSRRKTNEIVISYNQPLESNKSTSSDEDFNTIDDEQIQNEAVKETNNNNDNSIFESLNLTPDTPMDTTPDNNPVETVLNEEIHESSEENSLEEEQLPSEVISYAHLLDKTKDTSSSESEVVKRKRLLTSSPSSEEVLQKKKTKITPKKRAAPFILSSSSDENNSTLTSSRIQVKDLSSSDDDFEQPKNSNKIKRNSKTVITSDENDSNQSNTLKTNESESENEEDSSPTKGRKNIRKILDDNRLDDETKKAIEAERERRKRLAENQEKYNNSLLEQSSQLSTNSNTQVSQSDHLLVLELDKNTNEPLIEVDPKLVKKLKPHQCEGVKFLWNNVFESIQTTKTKKNPGNGCILAHCMGLGKTLQVISFVHTIFKYSELTKIKTCLVLCPLNTTLNWSNEFDHWLNGIEPSIDRYQLTTVRPNLRINHLNYWFENGGVAIMSYDLYKKLANGNGIHNKKNKEDAFKCLLDPGPDLIVADEGHILKNSQTALAKCLSKIKTRRRVVLTGTPLQNNLIEYYCMVSFIKPNLLGSQSEYINRFVNPIQNGQHRDSNESDVRLMKRRACVLHELLSGFIDRKDYSLLKQYLPPKYEYIINVRLSDLQSRLYFIYLEKLVDKQQRLSRTKNDFKSAKLFADYQYLQKIWTHPFLLYAYFINHWKKCQNKDDLNLFDENDSGLFLNDDELARANTRTNQTSESIPASNYAGFLIDNIKDEIHERTSSESSTTATTSVESDSTSKTTDDDDDDDDDDIEIIKTYPTRNRTTTSEPIQQEATTNNEPWLNEMRQQFWYPFLDMLPEESQFEAEISGKFLLLQAILDKCTEIGDKVIVFSRSIYTLNHIESFLHSFETETTSHRWIRDKDYFRMDGQTDITTRKRYAKLFNDLSNTRARLFLISTLAGGIGINLIGGNRVIIFDASWNPSHDTQAIFRSYRFGQKKPVYIYRFLAHGTMEEKIYQRQVVKQSLSQRVIDDHQLDRHFTQNDIKELYKFQIEQLPDVPTTATPLNFKYSIPKDHLLLDILYEHSRWIHSYHSHDSLLENKIDESLTAEERQRALQEYEELKRKPDHQQPTMQRIQEQQQRLNQNIFMQHQRAAMAQLQQVLQNGNVPNQDLPQIMRNLEQLGLMPRTNNPVNRPSTVQQLPRSSNPPANSTRNDVIVVESDEDPTHRNT